MTIRKRILMVKLPFLLSIFFPLLISAQSVEIKKFYDAERKVIKESYFVKSKHNKILQGPYKSYYINGNLKSKGYYRDNLPDGYWEYYYENKKLKSAGNLVENEMEGSWRFYFENGNINMEGHMHKGKRTGHWKYYYESGGLKMEGPLNDESKEGHWKYYEDWGRCQNKSLMKQ